MENVHEFVVGMAIFFVVGTLWWVGILTRWLFGGKSPRAWLEGEREDESYPVLHREVVEMRVRRKPAAPASAEEQETEGSS